MNTTHIQPDLCPDCGYFTEAATGINNQRPPSPGAVSICISCGGVAVWDADMRLVAAPDLELPYEAAIAQDLIRARGPIKKAIGEA